MNFDLIQQKLASLKQKQEQVVNKQEYDNSWKWKPTKGKHIVRLLPNVHLPDEIQPFLPLEFYYFLKPSILAPGQFGDVDPVAEFKQKLLDEAKAIRSTNPERSRSIWTQAQKLSPTTAIFVPVLVRQSEQEDGTSINRESEGVKFWSISKKVYQSLVGYIDDGDYGEIYDLKTGRDITVTYTPAKSEDSFPDISIMVKPNQTPASTDPDVLKSIKEMADVSTKFKKVSYEEAMEALEKYLKPNQEPTPINSPKEEFLKELEDVKPENTDKFDALFKK